MTRNETHNPALRNFLTSALFLAAALLIMFFRNPGIFTHPEPFWEDMAIFLGQEYSTGFPGTLLITHGAYIHLLPRLIAWAAMGCGLPYAMIVMNLIVLLIKACTFLLIFRSREITSELIRWALIAYLVLLPFPVEIYNNVTNLQWWLIPLMAVIILRHKTSAASLAFSAITILLTGLTGVNSVMFALPCAYLMAKERTPASVIKNSIVILCALVQGSDEQNRKALELTKQYFRKGIDGFDLAGPEGLVPMEHFRPLFAEVSRCSIPFTIHAGECGDPENVRTAVSFGAKRIGHGTAAAKSKEIMDLLRREDVTLEVCVTSNVQTCAVPDIASHPVRRFFDEGIKVTYNTDDMTVSGITLQSEAQLLSDKFGFTADELAQMQQNAAMASFAPERMIKKT